MRRELGLLVVSLSFTLACGGSVDHAGTGGTSGTGASAGVGGFGGGPGGDGGMGGGPGGDGGMGGGPGGDGGMGGMPGGAGGMGGIAGAGGSIGCGMTNDHMSVKVSPAYGPPPACAMDQPTVWEATGQVSTADGSGFQFDTCPPNADCMASFASVAYQAQDLYAYIPVGAFVHVRYELTPAWGGCTERLSVVNVPSWGGVPNPTYAGNQILFDLDRGSGRPARRRGFQGQPSAPRLHERHRLRWPRAGHVRPRVRDADWTDESRRDGSDDEPLDQRPGTAGPQPALLPERRLRRLLELGLVGDGPAARQVTQARTWHGKNRTIKAESRFLPAAPDWTPRPSRCRGVLSAADLPPR